MTQRELLERLGELLAELQARTIPQIHLRAEVQEAWTEVDALLRELGL